VATTTQYAPQRQLDTMLQSAGCSKTVYALVTAETEAAKRSALGHSSTEDANSYFQDFREAWTGKQEAIHVEFFDIWHAWSSPMINIDRKLKPFTYPTAGASEALFHLVADFGNQARVNGFTPTLHIFSGEYEGYKAYAEACGIAVIEHARENWPDVQTRMKHHDMFFISQPSAIDGMMWTELNAFLAALSKANHNSNVVLDATYVGATAQQPKEPIAATQPCVNAVVFSLSKPFGTYYDRIGGVFCRKENLGLFGNKWFKNISSLRIGSELMRRHTVFDLAKKYQALQTISCDMASQQLGGVIMPCDIFILGRGNDVANKELARYLQRPSNTTNLRLCLTPGMAQRIGMTGEL
jgi:hypothetical protein